jgi:chorismate mutase
MAAKLRAVRGATTLDEDSAEQVDARVRELMAEMIGRNGIDPEDLVSMLVTASPDVHSAFPASAARRMGLDDVPVIGAQELDVSGATPLCIRVMMHVQSERSRGEMAHVYLRGAQGLRERAGLGAPDAVGRGR